jgi:hypothetical protein
MKEYTIKKYQTADYQTWNKFITVAKNATFLFHRDFMEYHADRFLDHSLIVLDGEKWVAVLPANQVDNELHSHQGLTYGGLLYNDKTKLTVIIEVLRNILVYLNEKNINYLHIKTIPYIYHQKPADEILYPLYLTDAQLTKRDSLSVIDLREPFKFSKDRIAGINRGIKSNLKIIEVTDFHLFWNEILIPNMLRKHNTKPTHSAADITLLHSKFPANIRQFNVYENDKVVAGTTIFESQTVAHAQYIFADQSKSQNGCLDFLYDHLITNIFKNKKYLDFGSSNGYLGDKLNVSLSYWKQSFGASTVVQDFYKVKTANHSKLLLP